MSILLLEKQVVDEDQTTVQGEGDVESITTTETYSEHVDASSTSVSAPLSASAKKIQAVDVPKETDLAPECNIIINTGILNLLLSALNVGAMLSLHMKTK